jgi:malate dehydrogenase (oxaloacetate-decarboxylating)
MGGETPHSHGADEPRPGGQDGARLAPDGGAHLATAVGPEAQRAGVAPKTTEDELRQRVMATQWTPAYPSFATSKP